MLRRQQQAHSLGLYESSQLAVSFSRARALLTSPLFVKFANPSTVARMLWYLGRFGTIGWNLKVQY